MKRIGRFLFILAVAIIGLVVWHERTMTVVRAAEYLPVAPTIFVPEGSQIRVVHTNGITEGTKAGDTLVGFIVVPVVSGSAPVLPSGIQVNGTVEEVSKGSDAASVRLHFREIVFNGKSTEMETQPIVTTVPINSDIGVVENAIDILAGAGLGLALGTASQDSNAAVAGLATGTLATLPAPTRNSPQVTLVLTQPLRVRT